MCFGYVDVQRGLLLVCVTMKQRRWRAETDVAMS